MKAGKCLFLLGLIALFWPFAVRSQVIVGTYHNDNSRSGLNANETILTTINVNKSQFGKLFSVTLDGAVYTQPLYVANVAVPGFGTRNVIYVATEHDTVYGIDADTGIILWNVSFINPSAGITTVSTPTSEGISTSGTADVPCGDISPEMGVTGTPVIDSSSGTLYVVALTKENGVFVQRLHALDIATGAEKFGGPIIIQASVPGTGLGSSNGTVQFDALHENQRPALLLSSGVLYIGYGSHCDIPSYHGWLLAYNPATLQQIGVFTSTPNGGKGGTWQSGGGIAADADGALYFTTGNGTFDVNTGGVDYANSYLKLRFSPPFTVLDYFTPYNQATLNIGNDLEPASSGVLVLPDQPGSNPHLLVGSGKQGVIFLMNRDGMGEFNSTTNLVVQQISGQLSGGMFSTPAAWQNNVYFGAATDYLKVFTLNNGLLSTTPASHAPTRFAWPGATPSVSANGTNNAIVWALQTDAFASNGPAVLHAYNATNLGTELYNSNQVLARDNPGMAVKFSVPTIVNGKVYTGANQQISGYGLLPPDYFWLGVSPSSQAVAGGGTATATYTVSVNAMTGSTATVNLNASNLPTGTSASFNPPSVTGSGTSILTVVTSSSTPSANYVLQINGASSTRKWTTTATLEVQDPLPSPWTQQDVGNVPAIGVATYSSSSNSFTVQGSGTIGGAVDAFHYMYQPWTGDGQVIALVSSHQNTGSYDKVGVMIRSALTSSSTHVSMFLTSGHGAIFESRSCTNCVSSVYTGPLVNAPYWVWLLRQGNTFSGYVSNDGVHWSFVGAATVSMGSSVYVGLAVSSNSKTLNTSTFSNVSVGTPSANVSLLGTPSLKTLAPGGNATYNVSVNSFAGFADQVALSASGLPNGVSASFNPSAVVGSGSSLLTLTSSSSIPTATSPVTITGTTSTLNYKTSVALMTGEQLPSSWADQDVGSVYSTGGATYNTSSGTFAVAASAADIGGSADAFHFAYQLFSGDGQLVAHVASQQTTNNWAKAGVMMRETLSGTSRHASMLITPGNGTVFERRTCTGCSPQNTSGPQVKAPYWVKIVRQGSTFSGYVSSDGANWILAGSASITMNSTVYIGLAVSSRSTSLNTSTFDNIQ
jgi:regulation of enolase protein 1 (concanavalin A-like superfamily)